VETLLSRLLGIPENVTDVPLSSSRESDQANIKHTHYDLFQKQGIIANKDQLLYRQNEQFQPQAIKDTLPNGVVDRGPEKRFGLDARIGTGRRRAEGVGNRKRFGVTARTAARESAAHRRGDPIC
jgi:hypothetical protein